MRRLSICPTHGGRSVCEHGRLKRLCRLCEGSGICAHQRRREICIECSPHGNMWARLRSATRRSFAVARSVKSARTLQMVGCSRSDARAFIAGKMSAWNRVHAEKMTFANIHIDHIKPLARMTDAASLAALCHFSNLQPLLVDDNEHKSDHWSAADDEFWDKHIRGNVKRRSIYWPLACRPLHAAGVEWGALHMLARVALEDLGATVEIKLI